VNFSFQGRAIAQAVSSLFLFSNIRNAFRDISCKICGGKSDNGKGFPTVMLCTVSVIPPLLHAQFYVTTTLKRKTDRQSLAAFKQSDALSIDVAG
jgi:hypothetical protein